MADFGWAPGEKAIIDQDLAHLDDRISQILDIVDEIRKEYHDEVDFYHAVADFLYRGRDDSCEESFLGMLGIAARVLVLMSRAIGEK